MKKLILLMTLMLITFYQVTAQWTQLSSKKMEGTNIRSYFTAGPYILGISDGGVFRSADNGLTWVYSLTGVNDLTNEVKSICKLGTVVYIEIGSSSNIYKSTDNGLTWTFATMTGLPPTGNINGLGSVNNRLIRIVNTYSFPNNITQAYYSTNGTFWTPGGTIFSNNGNNWCQLASLSSNRLYVVRQDSMWYTTDGIIFTPVSQSGLSSSHSFEVGYNLIGEPNGSYFFYFSNFI